MVDNKATQRSCFDTLLVKRRLEGKKNQHSKKKIFAYAVLAARVMFPPCSSEPRRTDRLAVFRSATVVEPTCRLLTLFLASLQHSETRPAVCVGQFSPVARQYAKARCVTAPSEVFHFTILARFCEGPRSKWGRSLMT